MAEIWPEMKADFRSKRYYAAIADLEYDIVKQICDVFSDTRHKMPLPSDFVEASKAFKKNYFEKTGQYYGSYKSSFKPDFKPECSYCYDSGYEWLEVEGNNVFGFCFCFEGDNHKKNSKWCLLSASDVPNARRKTFPVKAFVPKPKDETYEAAFLRTTERFKEALEESHEFWEFYLSKK
jgi:hypothetical protein